MPQGNLPQGQWQGQPPSGRQVYTQYPQPPYPQPGKDMMPPLKPRKKPWRNRLIYGGIIVLILLVIAGSYVRYKAITSTNTATATTQPTKRPPTTTSKHPTATSTPSTVTPTPTVTYVTFGDGTYQIGNDIQPGKVIKSDTYRTRTSKPGCHYTRLGDSGAIIADNTTDAPAIITILPTDAGFQSKKCGTWTNNLSQITTSKTSFDDGMFIVKTDIEPGTYKNTDGSGCQYARLRGFGGTQDDIIVSKKTDKVTTVTILSSDKGFQSNGCGTWTKQIQQ